MRYHFRVTPRSGHIKALETLLSLLHAIPAVSFEGPYSFHVKGDILKDLVSKMLMEINIPHVVGFNGDEKPLKPLITINMGRDLPLQKIEDLSSEEVLKKVSKIVTKF